MKAILPPPPPAGAYDIRFDSYQLWCPLPNLERFQTSAAFPFTGITEHKLKWQLGTGASALVFELRTTSQGSNEYKRSIWWPNF